MSSTLPTASPPPESVCLLRLSALGDCMNVVPVVRSMQASRPDLKLTWVIGTAAVPLVGDLPGVDFVVYDKRSGRRGRRALAVALHDRRFGALCFMHAGMRANLVSRAVPAGRRIGFNRERSRDLHGLFVNERIAAPAGRHVLDGFFGFAEHLGLRERRLDWTLPVSDEDRRAVDALLDNEQKPVLAICARSSNPNRDWLADRYAAVADFAQRTLNCAVVLVGSPEASHRQMADAIKGHMTTQAHDLVGRTSLKQLYELLRRVQVLVVPDSGPAHFANAGQAAVIGLYACSESTRSGPYNSLRWCVDRFDQAARALRGKSARELPWGAKLEKPGVMAMIETEHVLERLETWHEEHHYSGA